MPSKKEENPFNVNMVIDKIGAPEKEWRGVVAKVFVATHAELHDMSNKLSRIEKENIAVIGILTAILIALIKTALGL